MILRLPKDHPDVSLFYFSRADADEALQKIVQGIASRDIPWLARKRSISSEQLSVISNRQWWRVKGESGDELKVSYTGPYEFRPVEYSYVFMRTALPNNFGLSLASILHTLEVARPVLGMVLPQSARATPEHLEFWGNLGGRYGEPLPADVISHTCGSLDGPVATNAIGVWLGEGFRPGDVLPRNQLITPPFPPTLFDHPS